MARYDRSELQDWRGEGYRWENSSSLYRAKWARERPGSGAFSFWGTVAVLAGATYLIFFL